MKLLCVDILCLNGQPAEGVQIIVPSDLSSEEEHSFITLEIQRLNTRLTSRGQCVGKSTTKIVEDLL